jgi:hypothetical protein
VIGDVWQARACGQSERGRSRRGRQRRGAARFFSCSDRPRPTPARKSHAGAACAPSSGDALSRPAPHPDDDSGPLPIVPGPGDNHSACDGLQSLHSLHHHARHTIPTLRSPSSSPTPHRQMPRPAQASRKGPRPAIGSRPPPVATLPISACGSRGPPLICPPSPALAPGSPSVTSLRPFFRLPGSAVGSAHPTTSPRHCPAPPDTVCCARGSPRAVAARGPPWIHAIEWRRCD